MREFEGQVLGRPSALASLSLYLHNVGGLIALLPPSDPPKGDERGHTFE